MNMSSHCGYLSDARQVNQRQTEYVRGIYLQVNGLWTDALRRKKTSTKTEP